MTLKLSLTRPPIKIKGPNQNTDQKMNDANNIKEIDATHKDLELTGKACPLTAIFWPRLLLLFIFRRFVLF